MASRAQRAAARRNIKKAQAALRRKGRSHPRKSRAKKSVHRHATKAMRRRQNKAMFPEAGKWMRAYRTLDVLTTSIQVGVRNFGHDLKAVFLQARHTALGVRPDGSFSFPDAIPHAEAIGIGLIRDKIRSKLGVYRGMAKGKIASYLIAGSPELIALGYADPMTDPWAWKSVATQADRAYNIDNGELVLDTPPFKQSITLDAALYVSQKLAEHSGINRQLSNLTDGMVKW